VAENVVKVDIIAENADLKKKLAETEAALAAVGNKGGKQADAGLGAVSRSAKALSAVMRLVAIPAIAIGAAVKFAQVLNSMLDPAKHLRNEFRGIADDFSRGINVASIGLNFGQLVGDEASIRQQANEQVKKITDALEATLGSTGRVLRGKVGILSGVDLPEADLKKQAVDAVRQVEAARDRAIANAREQRERNIKKEGAALSAQLADNDEDRLLIEHEQRKLDIRLKYNTLGNNAIDAATQALLTKLDALYQKSLDKQLTAKRKQIRDIINELEKAQTEGFSLGDLNFSNSGAGTALETLGNNFVSSFRNHGSGQ